MLTKIVPGDSASPLKPVQWPTADGSTPAGSASRPEEQLIHAELTSVRAELESLKSQLEHARRETDHRVEEALVAGRLEGETQTRKFLEPQLEAELNNLRNMLRELMLAGPKLRHQSEEDLVRLAVAIARRILHREVIVDPDAMIGLIKAAFNRLDLREVIQIRTDPDNYALLQRVTETLGLPRAAKVIADAGLRKGSLVIETARGELDASVETQLLEVQRGFTDVVNHG